MNEFLDGRPNWRKQKYTDTRLDLSNNLTYDSVLEQKLKDLYSSVTFDTRQYTDEYELYRTLSLYEQVPIKNIAIGFGIGEMIQRFFEYNMRMAIVSPTWTMPQVFSDIKNKPYNIITKIQDDPADILYVATPNGVDGSIIEPVEIRDIAKYYKVVIVDEAYFDWHDKDTVYNYADNIVVLRTLSKGLGQAGLRFSYAMGGNEIISFLQKHRPSCCSHSFMVPVLADLLSMIPGHVKRMQLTKHYLENTFDCKTTNANFVIFKNPPSNLDLYKAKGNRMALCDLELAKCLI